jgi:hypothetical protein
LLVVVGLLEELLDRLDGHLGSYLSAGVASHAIGNHVQVLIGRKTEVIFVMAAFATDVCFAGVLQFERQGESPSSASGRWLRFVSK